MIIEISIMNNAIKVNRIIMPEEPNSLTTPLTYSVDVIGAGSKDLGGRNLTLYLFHFEYSYTYMSTNRNGVQEELTLKSTGGCFGYVMNNEIYLCTAIQTERDANGRPSKFAFITYNNEHVQINKMLVRPDLDISMFITIGGDPSVKTATAADGSRLTPDMRIFNETFYPQIDATIRGGRRRKSRKTKRKSHHY